MVKHIVLQTNDKQENEMLSCRAGIIARKTTKFLIKMATLNIHLPNDLNKQYQQNK